MTDYTELVKVLRDEAASVELLEREFGLTGETSASAILTSAANAIEELLQKEKFHAFLWNVINPNDMQLYLEMYHGSDEKQEARERAKRLEK